MPLSEVYNQDCNEGMKQYPDKFFHLAIVDPEFGIGISRSPRLVTDKGLKAKSWDDRPIEPTYFTELFRISKHQIIWGGNYYQLPGNKHCVIWDKLQPEALSFGMFDYAWTSFDGSNKIFRKSVQLEKDKIHPTQKPIKTLIRLIEIFTDKGDVVIDPVAGSGSTLLASAMIDRRGYGFEIKKNFYTESKTKVLRNIQRRIF
jgi:site-specific DNA-methyltransferase (adenine-specific)